MCSRGLRLLSTYCGTLIIVDYCTWEWARNSTWHLLKQGEHHNYLIRLVGKGKARTSERLHRLIMNCPKGLVVDHKNKDTLDNLISNLRITTQAKNTQNRRRPKGIVPKYRGTSWDKSKKKWVAQITVNYQRIFLGRFLIEEEAARAYNEAAKKYFGDFAQLNEGV